VPESRFYTTCVARHLASGVRPRRRGREFALRAVLLVAVVVSVLGCSRRADPQGDARASAAPPPDPAASVPSGPPGWWEARSELPAQSGRGLFQGPDQGPELNPPIQRRPRPVRPADPLAPAPAGPLPPAWTYVGKVARDGEGFAVLAREERVYMVRVGDAVGNGYRVESISEREVVIRNADFDMTQTLFFSTSVPNAVLPQSGPGPADEPPPQSEAARD